MTEKNLDELLKFDPLARAEEITGVSIHDKDAGKGFENPAVGLGFLIAQENAAAKEAWLKELGDTTFSNDLPRYKSIIEKYGFELALVDKFKGRDRVDEAFYVYAHPKGLLLSFDTFNGTRVNGGHVYYQWLPSVPHNEAWQCTSSGGYHEDDRGLIWVGYHDCREALIHNLNKLNNRGEFITPWIKKPLLWLLHYEDSMAADYDHEAISNERISRMPIWVQDFINGRASPSTDEEPQRGDTNPSAPTE